MEFPTLITKTGGPDEGYVTHSQTLTWRSAPALSRRERDSTPRHLEWQVRLGVPENFQNGLAIGGGEVRKLRTLVLACEDIVQPLVHPAARQGRHPLKNLAVDHVRERIAE